MLIATGLRFDIEKHTDHEAFAFRVVDNQTGERHGFGMLLLHAAELADAHERWHTVRKGML